MMEKRNWASPSGLQLPRNHKEWTGLHSPKGIFLNRETLVAVLLLIYATIPQKRIDIYCANWLGRNNVNALVKCIYPPDNKHGE
ncbi:hypothetical protein QQ045_013565 [Rhodiola kirilowii]